MATIEGLAAVEARLAAELARIASAADAAMHENALDLMGKSQEAAPIEIGELRASADVRRVAEGVYEVGFYGQGIKALVQHERLDFNHPRGGRAKYLEGPFNENVGRYIENVRRAAGRH